MKKIFAIITVAAACLLSNSCAKDFLDTNPTDMVDSGNMFNTTDAMLTAMNGVYRCLYTGDWGSGWEAENGGLPAYILVMDIKGEDHPMDGSGSGWFFYDYAYNTNSDYTSDAGHQYQIWNFFYTLINNCNNIIAHEDVVEGSDSDKNYVLGQAYALRSYCYMWLIQTYQQNGGAAGSQERSLPGVPLYTEPTMAGTVGAARGTVQDIYTQANNDIDKAISLLEATNVKQKHSTHIDKYVAYGFKARHALVQQDFSTALEFAQKAMEGTQLAKFDDIKTVNRVSAPDVMWGLAIQTDQSMGNWDIFDHMDAGCNSTYSAARHLISNWLYDQIPDTDARKAWWTAPLDEEDWGAAGSADGANRSWCQKKLVYIDPTAQTGDHILMRGEEMYLIAAEAACELENYSLAREYLSALGNLRDSDYEERLAGFSDSNKLNSDTVGRLSTLMDEIFFQRRVELWGENPRLFDIQRRGLCFDRNWEDTNHVAVCSSYTSIPGSANFILWIPRSEFDGNENMDATKDQNPKQGSGR